VQPEAPRLRVLRRNNGTLPLMAAARDRKMKCMPQTPLSRCKFANLCAQRRDSRSLLMQMRAAVKGARRQRILGSVTSVPRGGGAFFTAAARGYQTWGGCVPNQAKCKKYPHTSNCLNADLVLCDMEAGSKNSKAKGI
jgi:hypothetical protein